MTRAEMEDEYVRVFTVEEANALLPIVRIIVERIRRAHRQVAPFKTEARRAADAAAGGGGGMTGGANYLDAVLRLATSTQELIDLGVQLKDHERGLIDFPSMRDDRLVLLCWQLGEGDRIEWWHDLEAGFAGRRRL